MLSADEMPEDNALLANCVVEFPRLNPDSSAGCPVPLADVIAYLALEVPDGGSLNDADLTFLRTARVAERDYWIWGFREPGPDGAEAFVTVCSAELGSICLGYETNYYGLTPEQFMLGDYHGVF